MFKKLNLCQTTYNTHEHVTAVMLIHIALNLVTVKSSYTYLIKYQIILQLNKPDTFTLNLYSFWIAAHTLKKGKQIKLHIVCPCT